MVILQNQNPSVTEPSHLSSSSTTSVPDAVTVKEAAETPRFSEDLDSTCSTPYVSAPSSPGRGPAVGYFFSAPASPMHYVLSSVASATCPSSSDSSSLVSSQCDTASFEFEFSSRFSSSGSLPVGSMSSADELFLNGQIRPMKLSSHLQRPQILAPLLDLEGEEDDGETKNNEATENREMPRGRDLKLRSRSLHRKARSLSPLRNPNPDFQWHEEDCMRDREVNERILEGLQDYDESKRNEAVSNETTPSCSASSSRSSSSGRNSRKWIFLKDLLYRSKSEGRTNGKEKFWSSISFSPSKDKHAKLTLNLSKEEKPSAPPNAKDSQKQKQKQKESNQAAAKKSGAAGKRANGVAKRRVPPSAHELHYTANRALAEEMKKRTYLPYRHGLFGCLGFSSKGYGALNGLAKSLNPVSSR